MTKSPIATVAPIEESDATGEVAEIYEDIRQTKGIDFVPNFWRVLATNPAHLRLVWQQVKTLMHPESIGATSRLEPAVREMIALAVSATNGCSYCVNSHTTALMKQGIDPETLGEVLAIAGLFNHTNSVADGYQIEPDVRPPQG